MFWLIFICCAWIFCIIFSYLMDKFYFGWVENTCYDVDTSSQRTFVLANIFLAPLTFIFVIIASVCITCDCWINSKGVFISNKKKSKYTEKVVEKIVNGEIDKMIEEEMNDNFDVLEIKS